MTRRIIIFFTAILFFYATLIFARDAHIVEQFSVKTDGQDALQGWEEKTFSGKTNYSVVQEDTNFVLYASADSAASAIYKKIEFDVSETPILSWRWKVIQLPQNGNAHFKETDDYGARVYVIFPRFMKWKTKTINYIWANKLPKGKTVPNAWLPKNAVLIAVESGADSLGKWISESRNIYKDYKQIFGEEPPKAGAIAIMTDSDNTGSKAIAFYDDFVLSHSEKAGEK